MTRENEGRPSAVVHDIGKASLERGREDRTPTGPGVVTHAFMDAVAGRRSRRDAEGVDRLAEAKRLAAMVAGWHDGAEPSREALAEVLRAVMETLGEALEMIGVPA